MADVLSMDEIDALLSTVSNDEKSVRMAVKLRKDSECELRFFDRIGNTNGEYVFKNVEELRQCLNVINDCLERYSPLGESVNFALSAIINYDLSGVIEKPNSVAFAMAQKEINRQSRVYEASYMEDKEDEEYLEEQKKISRGDKPYLHDIELDMDNYTVDLVATDSVRVKKSFSSYKDLQTFFGFLDFICDYTDMKSELSMKIHGLMLKAYEEKE